MRVEVLDNTFDPWLRLADYQREQEKMKGQFGATATFVGTMRDFNEGESVQGMLLEHYPGMTEKFLQQLSGQAEQRWGLLDSLIVHRVGKITPGEPIVLVAVWSAHRKAAFEACRFLMEELKSKAPFWKKETGPCGEKWVEKNTEG